MPVDMQPDVRWYSRMSVELNETNRNVMSCRDICLQINKLNVMSCRDICLLKFNIRHRHLPGIKHVGPTQKGTRRLNRFGGISQMYKHWERRQGDNPAAKQLIARFKLALKKKKLTAEQLGEQAPLEQGEKEDGYEHLRGPGELPAEDVFSYSFELHSQEHRDWLAAEGSI